MTHKVSFRQADIFATDFSAATVLTLYLSPSINLKLRPTILKMRPGTRVVSNTFDLADGQPDQMIESEIGNTRALPWIVPANVNGEWTFTNAARRFKVELEQKFQFLQSTPASHTHWGVQRGRVNGSAIELTLIDPNGTASTPRGRVENDRIEAQGYVGTREL